MRIEKNLEFEFIQGLTSELSAFELIFPTSIKTTMKIRHALRMTGPLNTPELSTGNPLATSSEATGKAYIPPFTNEKLSLIVSAEPVLSAQVLRMSHSIAYNPQQQKISGLLMACSLLGFSVVRNLAIYVGMKQLLDYKSGRQISALMEGLWDRSLRIASLCSVIARLCQGFSAEQAFVAGLLHDIGKFYILNRVTQYQQFFDSETTLWNVVDDWHPSIAAEILEHWDIDHSIALAVKDHKYPQLVLYGPASLTDIVMAADFLDAQRLNMPQLNWSLIPLSVHNLKLSRIQCMALIEQSKLEKIAY